MTAAMSLLVPLPTATPIATATPRPPDVRGMLRARSVIPGRQRWDFPEVTGRPSLARLIEDLLAEDDGITGARVNPVTGRLLVVHDPRTAARHIALRVHVAVARGLMRAEAHAARGSARADPAGRPGPDGRAAPTRRSVPSTAVTKGAALATVAGLAAFATAGLKLLANPVVSLGLAATATAIVVRRAWRQFHRAPRPAGAPPRERPLRRIIGKHKRQLRAATFLSVLAQFAEMAMYALVPSIILVLARGGSLTLAQWGLASTAAQLSALAGAAGLACAAMAALGYQADVSWRRLGQAVEDDWRTRTYDHVQRLAPADLENERTSRITSVLTEDIGQMGSFVSTNLHEVVQLATSFAVLVPVYLLLAPKIAWVAFAPVPLVTWLSFRFHRRAIADHGASGERRARLNGRMAENLQAHTTIKAACAEDHERGRVAELSRDYRELNRCTDRSAAARTQVLRLSACSALVGTLLLGGKAVLSGTLSGVAFGPLIEMPGNALAKLNRLGSVTDQYQRTLTALDRVQYLHDLPQERAADGGRPLPAQQVKGKIELRKVAFAYPGRPPALRGTSLTVGAGQTIGIVGTTGAGKTTIAKLLMGFRHPSQGGVLLDGTDVRTLALPDLRRTIGYVSQEPFLFDATIAENIRYGTFDATDEQLAAAARTAGAHDFIDALPHGYDTPVGERGAALSGGQRQRIALARAVLRDPPVVILDEATSAVDNETEAAIQDALQKFGANRTLIIIAHRLSTVRGSDRIYVLGTGGRVTEQGTHGELLARDGTYAGLWRLQAGRLVSA
ncbi:ATP-binding cassette domain-containing protein [Streptomyces sp. NPDC059650]|uniref:ABC transporter ATP-binding protein/permease n=1 Tax=Streptomyces sp. NPDC059650 TaxID=3346896 RepID=UPI00368836F7